MADVFDDRLDGSYKDADEARRACKDRIDVPEDRKFVGFDAYQKVLDAGADLVILATPPGFRPIHFEAAVKAGKHVFMEKPVATDAPGVRRVLAAAEEAKKKNLGVGVGLQRRHQASYLETIKRLQDGAIGDIVATRVYWNGSTPWVHKREELDAEVRPQADAKWSTRCATGTTSPGSAATTSSSSTSTTWTSINWLKSGYPVKANGMGGCQVRKGKDYGEIFDHHCVEFEYADGSRMFSQCRHIPELLEQRLRACAGHQGHGRHQRRHDQARRRRRRGAIAAERPTPTRSSTTICSPAFAPASRSTKPKPAPRAR